VSWDAGQIFEAREVVVEYQTRGGPVRSLDSASLRVRAGEVVAVVGESGSGKSTLGLAAGGLLPGNASYLGGDVIVAGTSVVDCDPRTLRTVRREQLGFIFQDPVAALNPTLRIGRQMELVAKGDTGQVGQALTEVGLMDVPRMIRSYPHELSGGMAQRVCIAMTLLHSPRLVFADEPTAAVDAAGRAKVLELLVTRCADRGSSLVLLTHDLGSVRRWCTRIAVMYGGRVVEYGPTEDVLASPIHPYTRGLARSRVGSELPGERLVAIPGVPPVLRGASPGCAFAPRCPVAQPRCVTARPAYSSLGERHLCCHRAEELAEASADAGGAGESGLSGAWQVTGARQSTEDLRAGERPADDRGLAE
jgi:peptide/nickel transport system ATP-binding protein